MESGSSRFMFDCRSITDALEMSRHVAVALLRYPHHAHDDLSAVVEAGVSSMPSAGSDIPIAERHQQALGTHSPTGQRPSDHASTP